MPADTTPPSVDLSDGPSETRFSVIVEGRHIDITEAVEAAAFARIEALERELAALEADAEARIAEAQSEIDKNMRDIMPSRNVENIWLGRRIGVEGLLAAHRARKEGKANG